jgi:hypothetical protein
MDESEMRDVEEGVLTATATGQDLTPDDPAVSVQDRLRKAREEVQENTTIDLTIPGYGGELVARHRSVDFKEVRDWGREITKNYRDPDEQQMRAAVDVIARTCTGIYLRPNGDNELYPLDPDDSGVPCRFDERLSEFLGFTPESARSTDVVRGVFGDRQLLIVAYQAKISRWLATANQEVDREMGEG